MTTRHFKENGGVSGSTIAIVSLVILFLISGSLGLWTYSNYVESKTNLDAKIELAAAEARKDQADIDEEKFAEREKEPNRQFIGPEDYGRLTFSYPKTWGVYVAMDVAKEGGRYEAYLNPITVPPVSEERQFALRVVISQDDYAATLLEYQDPIKEGLLKSSSFTANGHQATRLDGSFSEEIRGSAVFFKIRDKTLMVRTDANTFRPDFNKLIKTIDFNT